MTQIQLTSMPIVMIIVCVVLGLNVLSGAIRGFVRKISGIVAFFLAGILVTSLLPPVTTWLHTTPVYGFIREQCETVGANLVKNTISGALSSAGGAEAAGGSGYSGSSDYAGDTVTGSVPADASSVINAVRSEDGSGRLDRSKIKAQLQAMGYDGSIIDNLSDAELESYAQQLGGTFAGSIGPAFVSTPGLSIGMALLSDGGAGLTVQGDSGVSSQALSDGAALLSQLTSGMDRSDQMKFIESLPLPQSIKDQMEAFNNESGYSRLQASDFGSYIISYIASLIMNILAYAVTLLVTWLVIRLVLGTLSIFRHLPIVGTADHLLGLLVGLVQGVLIVWGLFLVLSMFATTQIGTGLMREIYASPFLSLMYNMNPFLKSAAGAIKGIM